jgi:threonine dehydratase
MMNSMVKSIQNAERRIRPHVRYTMLAHSAELSRLGKAKVYCKLENLQHTGSFKVRGAMNKLLSMTSEERKRGVVAASTGNHGRAVAHCLKQLAASGLVFVPKNAVHSKVKAIEQSGVEVRYYGNDTVEAEIEARRYATANDLTYISPYNDALVIHGQGTIGVELAGQLSPIDAVFVSLGGGGLISGIGAYIKSLFPHAKIIACSPENSQVMIQSIRAGHILDLPSLPTLSDGTAGGLEAGAITFDLCRNYADEYVTVTEMEIEEALRFYIGRHHMLIEGAAAVAVASYMKMYAPLQGKNVVIVICGANIDMAALKEIL